MQRKQKEEKVRGRTGSVLVLHPDASRVRRSRPRNPDALDYLQELSTRKCKINNMHRIKRRIRARTGLPHANGIPAGPWIPEEKLPKQADKQTCRRASMPSKERY